MEAQAAQIENPAKAVDVLVKARVDIIATMTDWNAKIVNISPHECTWYTYIDVDDSDFDPEKMNNWFEGYMGPYSTVTLNGDGDGMLNMFCLKNN